MKGQIVQVSLGVLAIDAVMDETCNYYVTAQSVASLFQLTKNNATYYLKSILGEQYSLLKISVQRDGANRALNNCISIRDFETVALQLAIDGNAIAIMWVKALVGLSLTQLCADAFNVKFDKADRQAQLKARVEGKAARRGLTDAIKEWGNKHRTDPSRYYSHCSDMVNVAVCGKTAQQLRKERGLKASDPLRDTHSERELKWIELIESHAISSIDRGLDPVTAVQDAINHYSNRR